MKRHLLLSLVLSTTVCSSLSLAGRAPLEVIAKDPYVSAIVIDADSGEPLFMKNPVAPAYPASVLKLMDLYVVLDLVQQGKISLTDVVTTSAEASRLRPISSRRSPSIETFSR